MSASGSELSRLRDSRLAPLASAALPAWLWSADAGHIVWANAVGAAVFGMFAFSAAPADAPGPRNVPVTAVTQVPGAPIVAHVRR